MGRNKDLSAGNFWMKINRLFLFWKSVYFLVKNKPIFRINRISFKSCQYSTLHTIYAWKHLTCFTLLCWILFFVHIIVSAATILAIVAFNYCCYSCYKCCCCLPPKSVFPWAAMVVEVVRKCSRNKVWTSLTIKQIVEIAQSKQPCHTLCDKSKNIIKYT